MAFLIVILMLNGTVRHAVVLKTMPASECLAFVQSEANHEHWNKFARSELGPQGYVSLKCSSGKLLESN